ncbi:MAG: hypothetical protein ACTHN4_03770 [Sphingomicrobium sp.]
METTERIVEAYVRYVKGWATIPNLRCDAQKEIDLFAIDPVTDERWHIETSVSISSGFRALTNEPFTPGEHKERVKAATARRKLGFFVAEKFEPKAVEERLACFGCAPGKLRRAIVTWEWKDGVPEAAAAAGIEVWALPEMMQQIAEKSRQGRAYLADDILRTIDLFGRGLAAAAKKEKSKVHTAKPDPTEGVASVATDGSFFVYENWTNKRARLHRANCSFCNSGSGSQESTSDKNGEWHGPFADIDQARAKLATLEYANKAECGTCM